MTLNIEDWRNYQNECHNWVTTVALSFSSLNNLDSQALALIFFSLLPISVGTMPLTHTYLPSASAVGEMLREDAEHNVTKVHVTFLFLEFQSIFFDFCLICLLSCDTHGLISNLLWTFSPIHHQWYSVVRLWLCAVCASCQFLVLPGVVCSTLYRASTHRVLFITTNQLLVILLFNQKCTKHRSTVMSFLWSVSAF